VAVREETKSKVSGKSASNRGRKKKSSSGKKKIPWAVLFWLGFLLLMLGLYLVNREAINKSITIIREEVFSRNRAEGPTPEPVVEPGAVQVPPPDQGAEPQGAAEPPTTAPPPDEPPPATTPAQTEPQGTQTAQGTETVQSTAELRERALYFIRIGSDGSALRVRAERGLPATDSPLRDVIQAVIAGPNAEERQSGLISLIPAGTRLLSVTIRGDTAYINFSEDFQYNTNGTEGYNGQLRQIVFTATEFPNVRDVQILIEGSRIDYLGESTWIGSPLNREMFQG
jgi:spore germination protein GerM